MIIQRLFRTVLFGVLVAAAPVAAHGQAPAPCARLLRKPAWINSAWVTGAWTGKLGERTIEQHWSAPLAGSIIAMYRSIQGNRANALTNCLPSSRMGKGSCSASSTSRPALDSSARKQRTSR